MKSPLASLAPLFGGAALLGGIVTVIVAAPLAIFGVVAETACMIPLAITVVLVVLACAGEAAADPRR